MHTNLTIDELISPLSLRQFYEEYWQKRPLYIHRNCKDIYGNLFTFSELDHLLALSDRQDIPLRVSRSDSISSDRRTEVAEGGLKFGQLYNAFSDGNTITIDKIHHKHPKIALFLKRLEESFGTCVDGMIIATPAGEVPGYAAHWDPVEVFVLQLAGSKRWSIWPANYNHPLPHTQQQYSDSMNLGDPMLEFTLQEGDFLYVPRGWIHRVVCQDDTPSLHLSATINICSRAELAMECLYVAMDKDEWFREALPVNLFLLENEDLEQTFKGIIEHLASSDALHNALRRLRSNIIAKLQPAADGHFVRLQGLDEIGSRTLMRKRTGMLSQLNISAKDCQVMLEFPGNKLIAPLEFEAVLAYILRTDRFTADDLPVSLDMEVRLQLVRRLVVEGLLMPVEQHTSSPHNGSSYSHFTGGYKHE